jgi:hypothetical protein
MLKRIAYGLCLALLLSTAAARAQDERPTSTLGGTVTFRLPERWVVGPYVSSSERGTVQATIPYAAAERAGRKAEVVLTARVVASNVTVRHESDGVSKNGYEGLAVLSDTFDGENWRTLVWTFRTAETSYLVLHRFGVETGKAVELRAALPLVGGGDQKLIEQAVADFNSACESLKIAGRNTFEHKVTLDKIAGQLKVSNR